MKDELGGEEWQRMDRSDGKSPSGGGRDRVKDAVIESESQRCSSASAGTDLFLRFTLLCIFILDPLFETVVKSRCRICIADASNNVMRCSRRGIFGISSSGNLLLKSKFVSLFHNFGNEYQSRPHKQGFSKRSRVLWASFQHCSCVTSPRAGVSLPGPPLNISHCRSLPGARSLSLPEKGNHNKLCTATSPYFPSTLLSLFLPLSLPISLSSPASLFSPTRFHFFLPQPVGSQCPYLCHHLLPPSQSER